MLNPDLEKLRLLSQNELENLLNIAGINGIASQYNCGKTSVFRALKEKGVCTARKSRLSIAADDELSLLYTEFNEEKIKHKYEVGLDACRNEMKRRKLPIRAPGITTKAGQGCINPDGYKMIVVPRDWPYQQMCIDKKRRTIAEHRAVMADHLKRALSSNESVHHINGIRHDNRLENLQLRNRYHGAGQCLECIDCGSIDIHAEQL